MFFNMFIANVRCRTCCSLDCMVQSKETHYVNPEAYLSNLGDTEGLQTAHRFKGSSQHKNTLICRHWPTHFRTECLLSLRTQGFKARRERGRLSIRKRLVNDNAEQVSQGKLICLSDISFNWGVSSLKTQPSSRKVTLLPTDEHHQGSGRGQGTERSMPGRMF